jgi:hypothetical protein
MRCLQSRTMQSACLKGAKERHCGRDHVRPCNLKPQQRDLTPVLRRPVEPAPYERTSSSTNAMSEKCQTEKNSVRAYVFRFALELGHSSMQSSLRFCANKRLMHRSKFREIRPVIPRAQCGCRSRCAARRSQAAWSENVQADRNPKYDAIVAYLLFSRSAFAVTYSIHSSRIIL